MYLCLSFEKIEVKLNMSFGLSVCWSITLINTGKNIFWVSISLDKR